MRVGLTLLGVYCFVQAILLLSEVFSFYNSIHSAEPMFDSYWLLIPSLMPFFLLIVCGLALMRYSRLISEKLFPSTCETGLPQNITLEQWYSLAILFVGLIILTHTVPQTIARATMFFSLMHFSIEVLPDTHGVTTPWRIVGTGTMVEAVISITLGVTLIVGAKKIGIWIQKIQIK